MTKRKPKVIVAMDTAQAFEREAMRGVMSYLQGRNIWNGHFSMIERGVLDALGRVSSADGMIIDSRYTTEALKRCGRPVVEVGYVKRSGLPQVLPDHAAIGRMAAEHLMSRGYRRFATYVFNGLNVGFVDMGREFKKVVEAAGYACEWFEIVEEVDDGMKWPEWHTQLWPWVKRLKKPVGVFATGDPNARDVAAACQNVGVAVPREVAILGVSDDELRCCLSRPHISSIDIGGRQVGVEAAKLLERLLEGKKGPAGPVIVPPVRVVVRDSTNIVAAADPHVVAAFQYIEDHLGEGASVKGMVRALKVGRRTLETAFRHHLDRTIHQEIARAKLERALAMLEEGKELGEIATACGMTYKTNLGNFFKKQTGLTPLQYRMAHERKIDRKRRTPM